MYIKQQFEPDWIFGVWVKPYFTIRRGLLKGIHAISDKFVGGKLLDVGCGRGDLLRGFKELNFDVEGVDLSSEAIDLCKPIKVRNYNLENNDLIFEKTYDYIFSKSVIEHIDKPINLLAVL